MASHALGSTALAFASSAVAWPWRKRSQSQLAGMTRTQVPACTSDASPAAYPTAPPAPTPT